MLHNLSPADATTYSCTVTVSSANPGEHLIRQISNQSMYDLRAKGVLYRQCQFPILYFLTASLVVVHLSPGGSRVVYYSGEYLNVTCISSVVGVVFTWRAVNITSQQPLIIPVSSGSNTSVLVLRPIRVSDSVLVDSICAVAFLENKKIMENETSTLVNISGNQFMVWVLFINFTSSSSIIECVSVFQC